MKLSSTITKKLFILNELGAFSGVFFCCFWGGTKTRCLQGILLRFRFRESYGDSQKALGEAGGWGCEDDLSNLVFARDIRVACSKQSANSPQRHSPPSPLRLRRLWRIQDAEN